MTAGPPGPAPGPPGRLHQQLAALRALYPDWDIWAVPTPLDLAGPLTWLARLTGAAVPTCHAKDPHILALTICLYTEHLHEHLTSARLQLADPADALTPAHRATLQAQADAITRLRDRHQPAPAQQPRSQP